MKERAGWTGQGAGKPVRMRLAGNEGANRLGGSGGRQTSQNALGRE